MVANSNLLSKIYFPRLIIPLASISSVLIDTLVSLIVLTGLMAMFGIAIGFKLLAAPLFLACALAMGVGVTLLVASLNVYYRDIGFAVPFALQLWNYITPVIYSSELIPSHLRALYSLNPTVGLVEGFRWSVLGGAPITPLMVISMLVGLVISVIAGMSVFQKIERGFADIV